MSIMMKMSLKQLEQVLSTIKRYAAHDTEDLTLEVKMVDADPGNKTIASTLTIAATASDNYLERNGQLKQEISVEMFERHEKQEPIASMINSTKLKMRN
jgi:hypothetical protein